MRLVVSKCVPYVMVWFTTGDGNEGWSWSKRNAGCDTRVAPETYQDRDIGPWLWLHFQSPFPCSP